MAVTRKRIHAAQVSDCELHKYPIENCEGAYITDSRDIKNNTTLDEIRQRNLIQGKLL